MRTQQHEGRRRPEPRDRLQQGVERGDVRHGHLDDQTVTARGPS